MAVLGIAGCSLLSCILGETGKLLRVLRWMNICTATCVNTIMGVGILSHVFNSSVNFVFYFFVASKFRPLLLRTLCCCSDTVRNTLRKFSTTSSSQVTTNSEDTTFRQQENKREPIDDFSEARASDQESSL